MLLVPAEDCLPLFDSLCRLNIPRVSSIASAFEDVEWASGSSIAWSSRQKADNH